MAVDPELLAILACPHCKTPVTLVKNGTALKCGQCHRVYPIKDDIPVMLDRRGHDRTRRQVNGRTVAESTARTFAREDIEASTALHPPPPHRRRRLHDAGDPRRAPGVSQARGSSYLVEPRRSPVDRRNPHLDEVLVIEKTRGTAHGLVTTCRWARRLRRAAFDAVIDFHGGPRSVWLTRATGAAVRDRLRDPRPAGRLHAPGRAGAGAAPASLRREPMGSARGLLGGVLDRDPDRRTGRGGDDARPARRCRVAQARSRGVTCRRRALVVVHVSAGNPFRRWPEEAFVALAGRPCSPATSSRRIILTAGPSDRAAAVRIAARTGTRSRPAVAAAIRRAGRPGPCRAARACVTCRAVHRR